MQRKYAIQPCRLPHWGHSHSPTYPYQIPLQRLHQCPLRLGCNLLYVCANLDRPRSLKPSLECGGVAFEYGNFTTLLEFIGFLYLPPFKL